MKTIKNGFKLLCVSAVVAVLNCSLPGLAAVTNVVVGPFSNNVETLAFAPAVVTINAGDSVIWTWQSTFHSTTSTNSPTPLWDSGVHNNPFTYTNRFNSAGSFGYQCTIHHFTGSVIVQAVSVAPTVTITNPANGITLSAPASFTLAASATNSDNGVTNVQFLEGTTVLGNVAAAPFSILVSDLAAADYTFSGIASDTNGLSATNSIIVHVINASPVTVGASAFLSPNNFQFSYTADVGLTYAVQVSTNLSDWNSISTNPATTNPMIFIDSNAAADSAFYRVELLPNP